MGDTNIIITPQVAAIFTGLFTVALAILGAFARAFLKRMERDRIEQQARMDRDKAELTALIKQSDERSEARSKQSDERSEALIKQSDERSEKRSEKLEALIKQSEERSAKRIDQSDERNEKRSEKLEADNQQRHSETRTELRDIQSELRDLNSRVGRPETPGVHDRSAGWSESQSPRRDHDSATAPEGESDPPPVAKHFDPSMVPPAGGRSETQHSAGLARQAVPDEQQVGETDSEPSEEESPDASR